MFPPPGITATEKPAPRGFRSDRFSTPTPPAPPPTPPPPSRRPGRPPEPSPAGRRRLCRRPRRCLAHQVDRVDPSGQIGRDADDDARLALGRGHQRHHAGPHLLADRLGQPLQVLAGVSPMSRATERSRSPSSTAAAPRRSRVALQVADRRLQLAASSSNAAIRSGTSAGAERSAPAASFSRSWVSSTTASAAAPVTASIRRTPAATAAPRRCGNSRYRRSAAHACRRRVRSTRRSCCPRARPSTRRGPRRRISRRTAPSRRFHRRLGRHQPCRDLGVFADAGVHHRFDPGAVRRR